MVLQIMFWILSLVGTAIIFEAVGYYRSRKGNKPKGVSLKALDY